MRKISEAEAKATHDEITQIRGFLLSEAKLLSESHDRRLVMYATITAAIHQAFEIGYNPGTFAAILKETMNLYTREPSGDE